jgi:hypothetical protein
MLSPLRCTHRGSRIGCFVKVDCAACHHVTLLTPEALLQQGLSPSAKVLERAAPVPRMGEEGAGGGFGEVAPRKT